MSAAKAITGVSEGACQHFDGHREPHRTTEACNAEDHGSQPTLAAGPHELAGRLVDKARAACL